MKEYYYLVSMPKYIGQEDRKVTVRVQGKKPDSYVNMTIRPDRGIVIKAEEERQDLINIIHDRTISGHSNRSRLNYLGIHKAVAVNLVKKGHYIATLKGMTLSTDLVIDKAKRSSYKRRIVL